MRPSRHPDLDLREPDPPDLDLREQRLAELVAELTGCDELGALHALREQSEHGGDALERVAGAMTTIDRPTPSGFRVPGYLASLA
jgi:hypothetical protein